MNRIGIFGVGAIGSVLANYLSQNQNNQLHFFNRTEHQSVKLKYKQKENEILLKPLNQFTTKLDWLVICVKAHQVAEAKKDIEKLISKQTKLAIFQNGINLSNPYRDLILKSSVLESVIDCPTERMSSTIFNQIRNPIITFPKNPIAEEFMNLFVDDEIQLSQSQDFKKVQWIKLIESSALGSIQSLTNKTCAVFQESNYFEDFKWLIKEGIDVARSEAINLEYDLINQLLKKLKTYPETKGSSMLTDKLNGNQLELEAKIGAIVKVANQNDIVVPHSQRYYKLLLSYNEGISAISP